jgi:Type IV secretion system pilin
MSFFKKSLLTFASLVVLASSGLAGGQVFAVDVLPVCNEPKAAAQSSVCKDASQTSQNRNPFFGKGGIGSTYISILALVISIASVAMIMFGGFKFITSGGDPQATAAAQKTVYYAIGGLVVAAFAQTMVSFVLSKLVF